MSGQSQTTAIAQDEVARFEIALSQVTGVVIVNDCSQQLVSGASIVAADLTENVLRSSLVAQRHVLFAPLE